MTASEKKASKDKWIFIFLFLFNLQLTLLMFYQITRLLYVLAGLLTLVILLKPYISRTFGFPKIILFWVAVQGWSLLAMIFNGHVNVSDVTSWGGLLLSVLNFILLVHTAICRQKQEALLFAGGVVLLLYLTVNLLTLFIFPQGIMNLGFGNIWLLGIRTSFTTYAVAAIALGGLNFYFYKRKALFLALILVSLLNIFWVFIATAIMMLLIFIGLLFLRKFLLHKMSLKWIILIFVVLNIAIIFFDAQMLFSGFLESVLDRNVTLTGRTLIWEIVIEAMRNSSPVNLLLGFGNYGGQVWVSVWNVYMHPHNFLLFSVTRVGILGTIALMLFFASFDKGKKVRSKEAYFLLCLLASVFVGAVISTYLAEEYIFIPFVLLYYMEALRPQKGVEYGREKSIG